jgi:hypothetical protein
MINFKDNIKQTILIIVGWLIFSLFIAIFFNNYKVNNYIKFSNLNGIEVEKLRNNLNLVAYEILNSNKNKFDKNLLEKLSNDKWWKKNLISNYKYTKSDTKNILHVDYTKQESLELDSVSLISTGKNLEEINNEFRDIYSFMVESIALISCRNLIYEYEIVYSNFKNQFISDSNKIKEEISFIEMKNKELSRLNDLVKSKKNVIRYVFESDNKSLEDQITSNNIKLVDLRVKEFRLNLESKEFEAIKDFLVQAKTVVKTEKNVFIIDDLLNQLIKKIPISEIEKNKNNKIQNILGKLEIIKSKTLLDFYIIGTSVIKPFLLYEYILAGFILAFANILFIRLFSSKL